MSEARAWLVRSLTGLLRVDPRDVVDHARLVEDLGADSLDVVEIVMAVEDRFGVRIDDDEAAATTRVDHLLALIERKVAAA